jgi:hypothetical protein
MKLRALILSLLTAGSLSAQAPVAFTAFRHSNTEKLIPALDWLAEFKPLAEYAGYWKEIAACQNIPLPPKAILDSVRFFYVNAPDFRPEPANKAAMQAAVTYALVGQIFIAVPHLKNKATVEHEMTHYLLFLQGETDWHDDARPEFTRCGIKPTAE